jgi:Zn-dependent protease with chaperone function
MADERAGWVFLSRELAADLLELADAEVDAARRELGAVGRRAVKAALLGVAALCLVFWLVALLAYVLVAVVALWLPPWGAGLVVAGLFALLTAILVGLALAQVKRIDNPVDIVVRRLREHLAWWRREVRLRPAAGPQPAGAAPVEERRAVP